MSWSVSLTEFSGDVTEGLREKLNETGPPEGWPDDVGEQQEYATYYAGAIAENADLGPGPYNVYASGHRVRNEGEVNSISLIVSSPPQA